MLTEELPVHRKVVEMLEYLIGMGRDFPKAYKFNLYDKMLGVGIGLLPPLEHANRAVRDRVRRNEYLEEFLASFDTLKTLIRICNETRIISFKQSASLAVFTESIGKQVNAWKGNTSTSAGASQVKACDGEQVNNSKGCVLSPGNGIS